MGTQDLTFVGGPCATSKPKNCKQGGKETWYWHGPLTVAMMMYQSELLKIMHAEIGLDNEYDLQKIGEAIRSKKKSDQAWLCNLNPPIPLTIAFLKSKITMLERAPGLLDPVYGLRWQALVLNKKNMPDVLVSEWMSISLLQHVFMKSEPKYSESAMLLGMRSLMFAGGYDLGRGQLRAWAGAKDYTQLGFQLPSKLADQELPLKNKRDQLQGMMRGIHFRMAVSARSYSTLKLIYLHT